MFFETGVFLLRNIHLQLEEDETLLLPHIAKRFSLNVGEILDFKILRKGVDARKKPKIRFVYTVRFSVAEPEIFWRRWQDDKDLEIEPQPVRTDFAKIDSKHRVVVVGSGPAGIFAALRLLEYGITPLLIERGRPVEERIRDVDRFWQSGELDTESNVQFGEGGAGTFSDGKLTTRVNDSNCAFILKKLVEFGAPAEIEWLAKPHVGSDRLRGVLVNIRRYLLANGVDYRFGAKLTGINAPGGKLGSVIINDSIEEPCQSLLLALGHSARDTYALLDAISLKMEQKAFAVGFRVEHPQELINRIQYGLASHPRLSAADYALAWNDDSSGRSAYSFCMCPGGVVVNSSSEAGMVVTNGMSDFKRTSGMANSALVATVRTSDFGGSSPLAGVEFQRRLERAAFSAGGSNYMAPAQGLLEFMKMKGGRGLTSSIRPGVCHAPLDRIVPEYVSATLRSGVMAFERKMKGFLTAEAMLTGVESRTSAPLRILRGEDYQSPSMAGVYPCGEGAGYAGGIMSAALDGIRVADAIAGTIGE